MKKALSLTTLAVVALSFAACGQSSNGAAPKKTGPVVATIGDTTITLDELDQRLEAQPITRSRLNSLERKKQFMEDLIRFELLAQEAKRQGLDKDPDVQEAMKRTMVQKLTQTRFGDADLPVTEEEAKAYYDENLHDFVKEERARVSHIFFEAAKGDVKRNTVRAEAERTLREIQEKEAGQARGAFAQVAKTRSDDQRSRRAGGDLSFRTKDELKEMWGEDVANAAFGLKTVGSYANLVMTDDGFHIVKLTGSQPELNRSFESVKEQIENRLAREKATKAFEAFIEELTERTTVTVDEEVLDKLEGGGQVAPVQMGGSSAPRAAPTGG